MNPALESWVRATQAEHLKRSKDAGPGGDRAFHDGIVLAMLVLLGERAAAGQLAKLMLASGIRRTRGLAGLREGFAQAEGVRGFLHMSEESAAAAWADQGPEG